VRPRITGRDGFAIVEQILNRVTVVSLSDDEYISTLRSISSTVVGGAAYDALIAQCAVKAGADVLFTWNVRDFVRFGPEIARLIKTPPEA
jgi:predicted nucleic acid-binding protein